MKQPKASFSLHLSPPPASSTYGDSQFSESMPSDLGRDAELMQRVLLSKPRPSAVHMLLDWWSRVAEWIARLWSSALLMIGVKR